MTKTTLLLCVFVLLTNLSSARAQDETPTSDQAVDVPYSTPADEQPMPEPEAAAPAQDEAKPDVTTSISKTVEHPTDNVRLVPIQSKQSPRLKKKTKDGVYIYNVPSSPQKESFTFHAGPWKPINLEGDSAGITYDLVYGTKPNFLGTLAYERQLTKLVGKFGLRASLGLSGVTGQGRFKKDVTKVADEIITLYSLPVGIEAIYRAQFAEFQILVPYAGAGVDYFLMVEYRPDKKGFAAYKYSGAPATHFIAGLQIQLDSLDRETLWQIDSEYGINHIYLFGGVRQYIGLSTPYNFTSTMGEGGVIFEF